jgi:hypothetical protein
MKNLRPLIIIAGIGLTLLTLSARAQSPESQPNAPRRDSAGGDEDGAQAEADLAREGRQAQARALLFTLSGEARGFRDQALRARSLARIADALWGAAPEQGRALFREAWEAAGQADRESRGRLNLRRGVLTLAARRDSRLAEELLQQSGAEQEEAEAGPAKNARPEGHNLWELPAAAERRLELAENLLSAGDLEGALQFADPVLGGVTISTLEFLTHLREKDGAAADRRYAALLRDAAADTQTDANTVSLLSSYIFTPHLYVVFNRNGAADAFMPRTPHPRPDVAPQLRLAFFQAARAVLLRPPSPPGQDHGTAGLAGKYMVLKRLLPLFEQYAPQETAAAVRAHFAALGASAGAGTSQAEDEWVRKGITPEKSPAEQERSLLDGIERATTSGERDELYFKLALVALGKDDAAARDYADRISDGSFRQRARAWVDWVLAVRAVETKKADVALALARGGELTPIQRVWVQTRAAKLLADGDRDRALALLDEATAEARRIDRADAYRARGLLAVAHALWLTEPPRAWEVISEAIEAANAAEEFTGEDGAIISTVNSRSQILRRTEAAPDFNIAGAFGAAAKSDFGRAAQMARGFKAEAPRVNAIIAVSRSVLNEAAARRDQPRKGKRPAGSLP